MRLVDSHCHLDFPDFDGRLDEVRAEMAAKGVTHAMCISTSIEGFAKVRGIAEAHDNLFASVGIHPDSEQAGSIDVDSLAALADHPKVLAIGETGLDYYRAQGDLEWQRERFRTHIRAARKAGKPLVIHTREAAADTLRIMEEERAGEAGGVLHCFTETLEVARAAIDLGFHISFSGIVTFKNAVALKDVARQLPLDRMLVETDSPYLAPVPFRGKTNQPAWVRHVAEEVARLQGTTLEAVAEATTANFSRLFKAQLT
jgi:TatD DNase family protein